MKINTRCSKCAEVVSLELKDSFMHEYQCNKCGYFGKVIIQKDKFELLYDLGIICLKKGYYKEAVSDFASSLERFYEYAIYTILKSQEKEIKDINLIWKKIKCQSERQFGAFIYLYYLKFNKILNIPKSAVEFRNKVIHQGYFPNYDETKDYAIKIYEIIIEVLSELFKLREEFNNILISKRLDEYKNYNGNNQGIEFNGYISFIDIFTLEKTLNDNFENKFKEFYKDNILEVPFG